MRFAVHPLAQWQLTTLSGVARDAAAAGPPPGLLLDGQVPHIPGVGTVLPQDELLFGCWLQPVSGHDSNLLSSTDILEGVKRRFIPGLKTGVATPRIR